MFGKSTRGGDTSDLKEAKTLLHELLKGGCSKNAAVQESGYGYKRKSRHSKLTSALTPGTDIRAAVSLAGKITCACRLLGASLSRFYGSQAAPPAQNRDMTLCDALRSLQGQSVMSAAGRSSRRMLLLPTISARVTDTTAEIMASRRHGDKWRASLVEVNLL